MKLIEVCTKRDKKRYVDFIYEIYKEDKNFSDMNIIFVKNFLYKKDNFAKRAEVLPIIVEDDGIKLVGMFISTKDDSDIKLSFLEFLPGTSEYLEEVKKYARKLMDKWNKTRVIIGINGQVSYGLGILIPGSNPEFEFNSNYTPGYYIAELDKVFNYKKKAYSYTYKASHSLEKMDMEVINRVNSQYEFRYFNKLHFKRDMLIFGELVHNSLKTTPYYAEKKPYEMYQLMKQVKFLFKNQDIIFAIKNGKEVGFVYTHPDYAEFFDRPKLNYVKLFFRFLFKKPKKIIYNVIGVLPEHQRQGLALCLIYKSIKERKIYENGVSSFILEENIPSNTMCKELSVGINKEYALYILEGDK